VDGVREDVCRSVIDGGSLSVGDFRDSIGSSRKYAMLLLEFFDREHTTARVGDLRVAGRRMQPRAAEAG
jgi:selenocysteine-specific elongation factor